MTVREIEKMLKKAGWYELRTNGGYKKIVTVPQHKGDLKKGTVETILKDAGLK